MDEKDELITKYLLKMLMITNKLISYKLSIQQLNQSF